MFELLKNAWTDESGQDTAEYGLLVLLIAAAVVSTLGLFKNAIVNAFTSATSSLNSAAS